MDSTVCIVALLAWTLVGVIPILQADGHARFYRTYLGIAFIPSLLLVCVGIGAMDFLMALLEYFCGE